MICDTCHELEAVFLLGNLQTGDQVAFCGGDFARFGLDAARATLPADEILAVLEIPTGGIVDGAVLEPPGGFKSKSKRKVKAEAEPPAVETKGLAEIPAAPADE